MKSNYIISNDLEHSHLLNSSFFMLGAPRALRPAGFAALVLSLSFLNGGCAYLPSAGPSSSKILKGADQPEKPGNYHLVNISDDVTGVLRGTSSYLSIDGARGLNYLGAPPPQAIAAGDTVTVTIFEMGGGLFGSSTPGQAVSASNAMPSQIVDNTGEITVPFAGRISVLGRTPSQVELDIAQKLSDKSREPQVVVTVSGREGGNLATISGAVKQPSQIPVSFAGTRVLDAISVAGGPTEDTFETTVTVVRGSQRRTDPLSEITTNSRQNIELQPGDTVILRSEPWSFLAFGATGSVTTIPFPTPRPSLAEAMALSGGPLDQRANPGRIFVYRKESHRTVERLGLKPLRSGGSEAVIYQLDLRDPMGFFLAQNFVVKNKDMIYYPNADSVGVLKFLGLVNAVTAPGQSALQTSSALGQ